MENDHKYLEKSITKTNEIITGMPSNITKKEIKSKNLEKKPDSKTQNTAEQQKKENTKALNIMQSREGTSANVERLENDGKHTISPQITTTKLILNKLTQTTVKTWANNSGEEYENIQPNQEGVASSLTSKYLKVNTLPIVTIMVCVFFLTIAYLYVLGRIFRRKNKNSFNCFKICCFYMK
jgi:hypothetical protein